MGNVVETHDRSFVHQEQLADKRRESIEGGKRVVRRAGVGGGGSG